MIAYVETSALLSMLNCEADGPGVAQEILAAPQLATSVLTLAETARRFRRDGLEPVDLRLLTRGWLLLELDEAVRLCERRYPVEPIRTLDALHIESAAIIARFTPVKMIALDKRVRENAAAMGWQVGP